jgi:hypothetical protein
MLALARDMWQRSMFGRELEKGFKVVQQLTLIN